jgi:hypothetical protein
MGQDWRTLGLVVVGTAIAGWLMVRVLGDGSGRRAASPTAAVATIPLPHRTEGAIAAAGKSKPLRTATSAEPAPPLDPTAPSNDADEAALIERELAMLAQGLRQDKEIEERVMPRVNGVFDQPNTTGYRRAPNFWESAFKSSGEMKP